MVIFSMKRKLRGRDMVRNSRQRREDGAAQSTLYLSAILAELKALNRELREIKEALISLFSPPHAVSGAGGTEPAWLGSTDQGAGCRSPAPTSNYSDPNNGDWRKLLEEIEDL